MTWASRHGLNVGCLKAKGITVWGGLKFSMGKPQERFSVNGRDGWHGRPSCVLRGGHGWYKGLSGRRRGGGRSMTCH